MLLVLGLLTTALALILTRRAVEKKLESNPPPTRNELRNRSRVLVAGGFHPRGRS